MDVQNPSKKYSKISSALKRCFLQSIYFENLTVKEAASRYKLNYSTAKVIIRDLNIFQKKFVKRLLRMRGTEQRGVPKENVKTCLFKDIRGNAEVYDQIKGQNSDSSQTSVPLKNQVEIVSRVAFDFFAEQQKGQ